MQTRTIRTVIYCTISAIYTGVIIAALLPDLGGDLLYSILRISGLIGYLSLSGAVIINLYRSNVKKYLGKPFLKIHHFFAFSGLFFITLHPMIFALQTADLSVFVPQTSSLYLFFAYGGRLSLILIYVAVFFALFQKRFSSQWKIIHRLMYPALILGVIHANMLGATFEFVIIKTLFNAIAIIIFMTGFILWIKRQIKRKK